MPAANGGAPAAAAERRSGSGIGIFVLGVAIGAGLALLYAPQTGEEARKTVARGARRMRRKARELAFDGEDEGV